jgi:hypothetical protein
MANEKVYAPEIIEETPFPNGEAQVDSVTQSSGDVISPATTPEKDFPTKRISHELISTAMNTRSKKILQEFDLVQSGALKIGNFEDGITGDLKITPNGLTARDKAGITTFAIDGTSGDAVFKGTLQAGSIISGLIQVGDSSVVIDGDNRQIIVNDGVTDRILIGYQKDGF